MSVYRHMMAKIGGVLVLAMALALVTATSTEAAQMLTLTSGLTSVTITDNGAGDVNPSVGAITFIGSVGAFNALNVSTGVSKPILGSAANPFMDLNSVNISSSGGGTLVIDHFDDGFTGLTNFSMAIGGVAGLGGAGGALTYSAFFNQGAGNVLIDTLGPFSGAFSGTGGGGPTTLTPYSLTQRVTIVHGAGTVGTSFNATLIPEPATLALFGLGLIGVGFATSRRRLNRAQN